MRADNGLEKHDPWDLKLMLTACQSDCLQPE